jgi:mannose-6-phosphate isomerase-like protein (cupin superfamily)
MNSTARKREKAFLKPTVRYRDKTRPISCPYGWVQRLITGGEGGVANVHVVSVTEGAAHFHKRYHEIYYVLEGRGSVCLAGRRKNVKPGAAVVVPAGVTHSIKANSGQKLTFVIFGVPPMAVDDSRAKPRKPERGRKPGRAK